MYNLAKKTEKKKEKIENVVITLDEKENDLDEEIDAVMSIDK